jgi:hypothetical protein
MWIAGFLALALASGRAHAVAPSERPDEPVASPSAGSGVAPDVLSVEVAAEIDDATLLPAWIAERHPDLARARRGPDGTPAQWIVVRITGSTYDYRVSIAALRDGKPLGPIPEPTRCECTTEELLELVDAGIEAASEQLRVSTRSKPVRKAEVAATRPPRPSFERSAIDAPSRRLGPLGRVGIGASVAGAGMTTAGALLVLRPREIRGEPGSVETRNLRDAGVGLATSGGLVVATGVALLVVDLVSQRRRSFALVPLLRPRMAGISLVRRF